MASAIRGAGGERLVHDAADGARAPPTLRTASEAAIDLVGRRQRGRSGFNRRPHVAVAENIAGTNDHYELQPYPSALGFDLGHRFRRCKKEKRFFEVFQTVGQFLIAEGNS
jgi:hypothetical protein